LKDSLAWYGITLDLPAADCVKPNRLRQQGNGYYATQFEGQPRQVHVAAWALLHGRWPQKGEEVRHVCGRGGDGCCNPHHLDIGSHADNMRDAAVLGTIPRGSSHWNARLSPADITEIFALRERGLLQREIAERFGIHQTHVSCVLLGKLWGHARS